MKKSTTILLLLVGVLAVCVGFLFQRNQILSKEKNRLGANQKVFLDSCRTYRTDIGNYAANVDALTFKVSELKGRNTSLQQTANELNIKLKRVQSYSRTSTSTDVSIKVPTKDSTLLVDNKPKSFKCFEYKDNWIRIKGCVADSFIGTIQSRDTIRQIVHRVPKKWLFFKWGTKAIRQEVVSSNPHTKIDFTEYIELQ